MTKLEVNHKYKTRDGQEICFPVATVSGESAGPHLIITAGLHGAEYPPIMAAIELYQGLDPKEISGTVTIVTIANVNAFENRSMFVTHADGINPNRVFPGKEDGTYTEAMVFYLFRDFISKADYHLDLHCGDLIESLVPFAEYCRGVDPIVEKRSKELASFYGLPHVIGAKCDLTVPYSGICNQNSARHGIPSALVEAGQHGKLDFDAVTLHVNGMKNVLRHVGILAGEAVPNDSVELYNDFVSIEAPTPGIFHYRVKPGDYLEKNQVVGHMEDYFGNFLTEVRSPAKGKIMYITDNPAMIHDLFILDMAVNNNKNI
jgi:predicted deacylase